MDGQNVLFLDGRVTFEHCSFCVLIGEYVFPDTEFVVQDFDNIYTRSTFAATGDPQGLLPMPPLTFPANEKDSLLVHDPDSFGSTRARGRAGRDDDQVSQ